MVRIMTKSDRGTLFWAPRILTILFALFISVFALDVFGERKGLLLTLAGLVIHLIPTLLVILLLVLAWRWELIGVIAFASLGITYIILMWGRFPFGTYAAISGPLLLISVLFFLSWRERVGRSRSSVP